MNNSGGDPVGPLLLLAMTLGLCIAVVLFGVVLVILMALLFLGWVLTYWLLRMLNDLVTDNLVTESEGLLALIVPAILWAVLAWWLIPDAWIWAIATYAGWSMLKSWLTVIIGSGLLGLGFGFLALFMLESKEDGKTRTLDGAGMLPLPEGQSYQNWDDESWDIINDGVLLGDDF